MNWRNRSTGRLSFVVSAMTFGGLTSRLFTTWGEVQDIMLLLSVGINWLLMAMLMSQFVLFPSAVQPQDDGDSSKARSESMVSLVYPPEDENAGDSFTLES